MHRFKGHWEEAILAGFGVAALLVLVRIPFRVPVETEPCYQQKPLTFWVQQLDSPRSSPAKSAIRGIGLKAVPFLLNSAALQECADPCQVAALGLLGRPALPALAAALEDRNPWRRLTAVRAIVVIAPDIGPQAPEVLPALIQLLRDPCSDIRHSALLALNRIGPSRIQAVPALVALLRSAPEHGAESFPIQRLAVHVLGKCRSAARMAIPDLVKLQADSDPWTQQEAALALRAINQPSDPAAP